MKHVRYTNVEKKLRGLGLQVLATDLATAVAGDDRSAVRTVADELASLGKRLQLGALGAMSESLKQALEDTL